MYSIWSTAYLEYEFNLYTCYISETLWRKINNDQITNRMFAKINKGDKYWICAVGAPINTAFPQLSEDVENIFVPLWMLEQIGCQGQGEILDIDWMPCEAFDETTKVVLKHLDGEEEVENIQEYLSNELTKLAILQKHTLIQVENLRYLVEKLEPSSVVLCQGDNVELEFSVSRPPTPIPSAPPVLTNPDEDELPTLETTQGNLLGGVQRTERFNPWRNKDFKPSSS